MRFEEVDVQKKAPLLFEIDIKAFTRNYDFPARDIHDTISYLKDSVVYLVYEKKVPVGLFAFEKRSDNTVEVKQVIVLPEYQGKGYGTKIMKKILSLIKGKNSWLVVHPRNRYAVMLYLKFGFEIYEWRENYYGNGHPRLILKLHSA